MSAQLSTLCCSEHIFGPKRSDLSLMVFVWTHECIFTCTVQSTYSTCGWMRSVCLCVFMQTCYLDSCIPVIWAHARAFWEADRCNEEGGRDEMRGKRRGKERMRGFWLLLIPSTLRQRSQGLFLSPLRSRSHKQADCDVTSCLFSSSSVLLSLHPLLTLFTASQGKCSFP